MLVCTVVLVTSPPLLHFLAMQVLTRAPHVDRTFRGLSPEGNEVRVLLKSHEEFGKIEELFQQKWINDNPGLRVTVRRIMKLKVGSQ